MAFSYGFYNSLNGDRKYDAEDISRMFDGLITDGVIGSVGDSFAVKASSGNTVSVSSGRAWFNHTWTYNDAPMLLDCGDAASLLGRYDAVVLEVNNAPDKRVNSIKVIAGTSATNPEKPTLENSEYLHQYPLAYILRDAGSTSITQAKIENAVGTSECPLCAGVLKTMTTDQILAQWDAQFNTWFESTKDTLSGDVAGNLVVKIDAVEDKLPYKYNATFTLDKWTDSTTTDKANGYPYRQTATLIPDKEDAPNVTPSSTFASGCGVEHTGVASTDDALDGALSIINEGKTVTGYQTVTTIVKEKPTAEITVRWDIMQ